MGETGRAAQWTARPWVARLVRAAVYVIPLAVSIATAWVLSDVVPKPDTFVMGVVRWFAIALASTVVLVGVEKLARRLLPLATLFGLTLAFPDHAPSRFRLALRTGSTAQLRRRIEKAQSGVASDTPAAAAERVLELVIALNAHDRLTRGHSERVRAYSQMIGEQMNLTDTELDRLRWSGLLHDIGKLRISGAILNKPGKLTDAEFGEIKLHPEYGRELVAPLIPWLGDAARAVWEHHERWDGRGYPHGLSGTDISLAGRIVSVADTYDVITSVRSYKKAISPADARAELTRCAGTQFDPAVVRAFMNLSLGRVRLAMGPLSWLAQVPLFPQALTTTAAGTAGATTAFAGAAAASLGLGLAADPIVPRDRVAFASPPVTAEPFEYAEPELGGRRSVVIAGAPGTTPPATDPVQPADPAPPEPGRRSEIGDGAPAAGDAPQPIAPAAAGELAPTTTGPLSATTSTTPDRSDVATTTTTSAPVAATTTSTRPPVVTTRPPFVTATTVKPLISLPGITISPLGTILPILTTSTTSTVSPAPTTTVPPRPAWLPPAGVPTTLYMDVPASVDLAARPVLPLVRSAPIALAVTDADGDGRTGITLERGTDELSFGLTAPTEAHIVGGASGIVYISTTSLLASTVSVRARLVVCDQAGACTIVSERFGDALVTVLALPIVFDFGAIDATVPAAGTLRVVLDVPPSSAGDALLSADATLAASSITVVFG